MRVYLDTEFTCLNRYTYALISLALVAADGRELYIELTEGWTVEDCSPFTREVVLPQLNLKDLGLNLEQARAQLLEFLSGLGECEVVSDSMSWDWPLLIELAGRTGLPDGVVSGEVPSDLELGNMTDAPHHALQDARMLCRAMEFARPSLNLQGPL